MCEVARPLSEFVYEISGCLGFGCSSHLPFEIETWLFVFWQNWSIVIVGIGIGIGILSSNSGIELEKKIEFFKK